MTPETRAAFVPFTDPLEGKTSFLYADSVGLVTCGRGNLVDWGPRREKAVDAIGTCDPAPALALGWKNTDGSLCTAQVIRSAWWTVKLAWPAHQSFGSGALTTIRLDEADVDALTYSKLDQLWSQLAHRWPAIEEWPSCAQLGVISMAWAMGAAFDFPKFAAAAQDQDWLRCAQECRISNGSAARNAANQKLFLGASLGQHISQALETANA